jgi:vacuolar-type H+-ATPase subunit F/Vma7
MKAAVLGDADTVTLCRMAGITRYADDADQLDGLLTDDDLAVVLITDEYAEQVRDKIVRHRLTKDLPIVIEIPGKKEIEREDTIKRLILRAVGVEVE